MRIADGDVCVQNSPTKIQLKALSVIMSKSINSFTLRIYIQMQTLHIGNWLTVKPLHGISSFFQMFFFLS